MKKLLFNALAIAVVAYFARARRRAASTGETARAEPVAT
jgi:hypothetical protein